jgi:penicillin-binding protein 1A
MTVYTHRTSGLGLGLGAGRPGPPEAAGKPSRSATAARARGWRSLAAGLAVSVPLAWGGVAIGDAVLTTPDRAAIISAAAALTGPSTRPAATDRSRRTSDRTALASAVEEGGPARGAPSSSDAAPQHLVDALLATEDRRFFAHGGVDFRRLVGAAWATLNGHRQGGSTLTQQLARNLFPDAVGRERTLTRKLRELIVALRLEQALDKDEILALYLRVVPFRQAVRGVSAASDAYFGKPLAALAPSESALLVAMLKGPSFYDPDRWPQRANARRDLVLRLAADYRGAAAANRGGEVRASGSSFGAPQGRMAARSAASDRAVRPAVVAVSTAGTVAVASRP